MDLHPLHAHAAGEAATTSPTLVLAGVLLLLAVVAMGLWLYVTRRFA